jgi:hypothetical protein
MTYRAIPPRYAGYTRLVDVATSAALDAALSDAQPGDLIRLQLNTVFSTTATRFALARGTKAAPIVVLGDRTCVVTRPSGSASTWLMNGAWWWTLDGFKIDGGATSTNSALRLFGARCCLFYDMWIGNTGQEACAVRGHSKFNRFLFCTFDETGKVGDTKYGEGLYIGRSSSDWLTPTTPDRTDYTEVLYCTFGDWITSDNIDNKAGTTGTVIVGCSFSDKGHSREGDELGFEAPIAIRGNGAIVRDNVFRHLHKDAIKVEYTAAAGGWGNNNVFRGNHFDLTESDPIYSTRYGVRVSGSTTGNIVYNDNTRVGGTAVSNISLTAAPAADFTYRVEITPAGGTRQLLADWSAGTLEQPLRAITQGAWTDHAAGTTTLYLQARDTNNNLSDWAEVTFTLGEAAPTQDVLVTATAYSDPDGDPGQRTWRVYAGTTSTVVQTTGWVTPATTRVFTLAPGDYEFSVQDRDIHEAESAESARFPFTVEAGGTPPLPASNLIASAVSPYQVNLTWTPGVGATTHKIYRAVGTVSFP